MIFQPQHFAPEDHIICINCANKFNHRIGGILWQGKSNEKGFLETFICSHCAPKVIPSLLKDFINLDCWTMTSKHRMQYMIDAGERAKDMIDFAD